MFKQKTDVSFAQVHCFNALTIVVTINEHCTVMTFKNHFIVAIYDGHFIPKLTHLPQVPHIYVSPSHYLNQWWIMVNWTPMNKTSVNWNLDQNIKLFVHEKALKDVVCKMVAILSRRRWVNICMCCASWDFNSLWSVSHCECPSSLTLDPCEMWM